MSRDFQKLVFTGMVKNVEDKRAMPSGAEAMSLAVKSITEEGGRRYTTWFRCTAIGKMVEDVLGLGLRPGDTVNVSGRLMPGADGNPKIWEKNGKIYSNYEIRIETIMPIQQAWIPVPDEE